jgi:hypothetical protein
MDQQYFYPPHFQILDAEGVVAVAVAVIVAEAKVLAEADWVGALPVVESEKCCQKFLEPKKVTLQQQD